MYKIHAKNMTDEGKSFRRMGNLMNIMNQSNHHKTPLCMSHAILVAFTKGVRGGRPLIYEVVETFNNGN